MILRLSPKALNLLFKNIWPMLLTLLIEILKPESKKQIERKNLNLILAALKLIELINVVKIEEFYNYQWIFVFDCNKINF